MRVVPSHSLSCEGWGGASVCALWPLRALRRCWVPVFHVAFCALRGRVLVARCAPVVTVACLVGASARCAARVLMCGVLRASAGRVVGALLPPCGACGAGLSVGCVSASRWLLYNRVYWWFHRVFDTC